MLLIFNLLAIVICFFFPSLAFNWYNVSCDLVFAFQCLHSDYIFILISQIVAVKTFQYPLKSSPVLDLLSVLLCICFVFNYSNLNTGNQICMQVFRQGHNSFLYLSFCLISTSFNTQRDCHFYPHVPRAFKDRMDLIFMNAGLLSNGILKNGQVKKRYCLGFICYHTWGDELEVVFQLHFCCWQFGSLVLWKDS